MHKYKHIIYSYISTYTDTYLHTYVRTSIDTYIRNQAYVTHSSKNNATFFTFCLIPLVP